MRHRIYGKHLGRSKNERTSLFKNLIRSLVLSEQIQTTEAKAKTIKGLIDKLINSAKISSNKPLVQQFITEKLILEKLVKDIVPRFGGRSSGYTSMVRLGKRLGDSATLVQLRWVEKPKRASVSMNEKSPSAKVIDSASVAQTRGASKDKKKKEEK